MTQVDIYQPKKKSQRFDLLQWLALFRNADFVVTDSYHGVIFSLIFNKQFVAISNSARGAARFNSLLGALGLEKRLITEEISMEHFFAPVDDIDYAIVNRKLEAMRMSSQRFLTNVLQS